MLSRVADALYWMSRYLERAEHTARVLDVHLNLMLEQPAEASVGRWQRVAASLGLPDAAAASDDHHAAVQLHAFDHANRSSIVSTIMSARENARQVREQISSEMWEQLNRLFHEVRRAGHSELYDAAPVEFLHAVKEGAHLFQGLTDSTLSHGEEWQFIQLGRCIERAVNTTTVVGAHFEVFGAMQAVAQYQGADESDYLEWIGLLKCATAFEAYCKVYTATIDPLRVAEFLILNAKFPHSLCFSVEVIESAMKSIADVAPSRRGQRVQRLAGRLRAALSFSQLDEIITSGLQQYLADIRKQCEQIHSNVYQAFIAYPIEAALEV